MKKRILSFVLALLMVASILPAPTFAVDVETTSTSTSVINRTATFNTTSVWLYSAPDVMSQLIATSMLPQVVVITAVEGEYYCIDAAIGYTWPKDYETSHYVKAINLTLDPIEEPNPTEPSDPSDSTDPMPPSDEEVVLEDAENGVTVSGSIPEGVVLDTKPVFIDTLKELTSRFDETSDYNLNTLLPEQMTMPYASMDIKLMDGDNEWQPSDGATVTVSLDAAKYGLADGDDFVVFHLHEEGDGVLDAEWIGPYKVENGKAIFEMSRFSYVLILNSTLKIENVGSFYPVKNYAEDQTFPESTNGNWCIVGIYYDENDVGHVLLGQISNNIGLDKVSSVTVNGIVVPNENNNIEKHAGTITSIILQDSSINEEVISFNKVAKKRVNAIWDITCKDIDIFERIKISLDSGSGGFDIGEIEVDLYLEYNIIKSVAVGTSADATFEKSITVERGDWVIYRIELNNTGTSPLEGMLVQDILPDRVFDMSTVQMSIDGEDGAIGNWEPFNQVMFDDYSSDGEFNRLLYIKAQVLSDLDITQETTYTNKVTIDGMGMPTKESSADIIVKAPVPGVLTVSKTVTTANPNDPAPVDATFTFTLNVNGTNQTEFAYKLNGTSYTISNGGIFQLKNGESAVFAKFPVGAEFTVTETQDSLYTTSVSGSGGNPIGNYSYKGKMEENGSPVVAFVNQYKLRTGGITVEKEVETESKYDTYSGDPFTFTVVFGDGTDTTTEYEYTTSDGRDGKITNGGTITIKGGESFNISGVPNNTPYTITETENNKYITKVGDAVTNVVEGTSTTDGTNHTFTNILKQQLTALTIRKQGWVGQDIDPNQTFIFELTDSDGLKLTVTVHGNGSTTIYGLTANKQYTITEKTDWSWRYGFNTWSFITDGNTAASGATNGAEITLGSDGNEITFTNTRDEEKWLDGDSWLDNLFKGN